MTERAMTKADLVTAIILLVFSAAVIANSLAMPTMVDRNESAYSGPGLVPAFIGSMIFILSGSMLIRSIQRGAPRMFSRKDAGEATASGPAAGGKTTARIAWTVSLCASYALLLGRLWFPLITFLFVFGFVLVFEYDAKAAPSKQWKVPVFAAILALLTSAAVFGVFQYLFLVNLP